MEEQDATRLAREFAAGWPGKLQAHVEGSTKRQGKRYRVCLLLLGKNRRIRITRMTELEGVRELCKELLGEPGS
jgi:hypothetical protein